MKRFINAHKKALAAVAATAVIVAGSGVAFAYWTTPGSGTGSATNAVASGTVTLHASFADGLSPGNSESVTFTADNSNTTTSSFVGTIHLFSVSTNKAGCTAEAADFTMPDVTSNTVVAPSASAQALTGTGTLSYANTSADQNACQGAIVTLHLSS